MHRKGTQADGCGKIRIDDAARRQNTAADPSDASIQEQPRVQGIEHIDQADHHQHVALFAPGGDIDRAFDLRIAAGEIKQQIIIGNGHLQGDAAGMALGHILVHVVVEDIVAIGQISENGAGLTLGIIQQIGDALLEGLGAELGNHLVHAALARVHGRDLRLQITPVLFRHAHVGQHDGEDVVVHLAPFQDLGGRYTDAFLMDLGQGSRQASRNGAANVGVVNMAGHEANNLAFVKNRLPDMHVR